MEPLIYPTTQHFAEMSGLEWIESDGVGGIAMSTAVGANTRKQHGLLSLPDDRGGRIVLLAGIHDTITQNGVAVDISTNVYRGGIHPAGYRHLQSFSLEPWPTWRFRFDDFSLEKQIFMPHGEHTVIVVWELRDTTVPARLCVRPMMAFRGQHDLVTEKTATPGHWQTTPEICEYRVGQDMPALFIAHPHAEVDAMGLWYRDFLYDRDADSHLECMEDLYHPARIEFELPPNIPRAVIFSTPSPRAASHVARYMADERMRRRAVRCASASRSDSFYEDMLQSADAFVCECDDVTSLTAGIPWGGDEPCFGLVTMPGLLLAPRYFERAFEYLDSVAEVWRNNRSPLCFSCGRNGALQIPATDVPLWLFIGVWRYWKASGDTDGVRERLTPVLCDIIETYMRGGGVLDCDETGLLAIRHADTGRALAYPLSSNALWCNALMMLAELETGKALPSAEKAELAFASMARLFPCESRAGLAHSVEVETFRRDEALHASQVLALALPHNVATDPKPLVELIRQHLATPLGLRTISPEDPAYVGDGSDMGTPQKRWSGSVDPAWFGLWRDAQVRAGCGPARHEDFAAIAFEMTRRGLGHVSGAFTGAAPHEPLDYVAGAAGLAEAIRIYARDVLRMPHIN